MDWTSGLNMEFPIYNEDGTSFNNLVLRKATVDSVVMSLGDKITGDVYYKDNSLVFTMHEYVVYKNVKYALVNPPTIVREGLVRDNSELKGMTKYSFEFYHPMYILNNLPFSDVAVSSDETRYLSENKTFSWIGKPDDFIAKLNKNLEGTEWVVVKSDRFPKDKANTLSQVLQFDKNTIGDALKKAYEEWDIPYVIDSVGQEESYYVNGKRFKVVVGLPSNEIYESDVDKQAGIPFVFKTGQGVGLKNNSRTPRNNKIVTRLSGYGSERNIPYGYPQIVWNGNQNWDYTINNDPNNPLSYLIYKGIVGGRYVKLIKHPFTRTHLMPSIYSQTVFNKVSPYLSNGQENPSYNPAIEIKDYYDAIGSEYPNNINETSPSYEIHEFDTYPQMNDDNAHTRIANAVPLDKNLSPVSDWDDSMDDDGNYIQSYFQITLPLLEFDIYACAAITEEMKINMRSGACIGCTFDVQVDWDDYKKNFYDSDGNFSPDGSQRDTTKYPKSNEKSISVVVKKDNTTFGTLMPNIYKKPNGGDEFVVLGISLPNEYIKNAEKKLDEEMKSYMLENNVYYYDYPLKFDEYFLATHTNILSQLKTNSIVHFDFSGNLLQLFVKQITIKYGNAPLPQYDITLADNIEVVLNQIGKVADDVEHLGSLISMLRQTKQDDNYSLGLAQKLSKVEDDTASGLITFLKGLVSRGNVVVNGLLTAYNAVMNTIKSSNYTGDGFADSGWSITNDYTGSSRAVFDYLYIRKKAVFESLEIKELQFTSGDLAQSLASATIERTDYLQVDEQGEETILGYSDRKIPWTLKGFLMRLSSRKPYALARNKKIRINLKPEDLQNVNRVRCYFLAKDDDKKIFNLWKVNDLARCQTFNIDNIDRETYAGETHKAGNVFWWRLVKGYSTEAVTLDGKEYHYFDVAYGYTEEQEANRTGVRTAWCDLLSDLPAAGDKVVQFGNTSDPARMNIIVSEVNGDGNVDAPSIKSYRGVHTFNTDDDWWGGESCRKMMLSPSSGVEFYAPSFKFITEYGIERTQVERGAWLAIQFEKDKEHQTFPDYSDDILDENGNFVSRSDGSAKRFVRKCRYYDRVEHKGSTWLCTIAESHYWRKYNNGVWSKITEEQYKALPQKEKDKCEEVRNYTTDEPSKASNDWTVSAERGEDGGFKSRVFCRTNTDIRNAKVTGGRYDNPIPTLTKIDNRVVAIEWTDGIPQGTEILWSTVCTFYGDGSNSGWSKPAQETDTETLDIEFSPNAQQPANPTGTAADRNTSATIAAREQQGWYDPSRLPADQQMIYRAECKIKNGVYETKDGNPAWVITRIKGEKGTSVREVKPYYAKQSPESYNGNPPQDGWEEGIAALGEIKEGWYVWTKNVISFTDNVESTTTYTVSKWGIDGDGIENIETKFYESATLLTQTQLKNLNESNWVEYNQLALKNGDYIYTRTKITYDKSGTPTISYQVNRLGQDGVGYVATEEYYVLGNSQTDVPTGHPYTGNQPYKKYTAAEWQQINITGGWSESRPAYKGDDKKYLWNFEVSFDTDGNAMVTRPICIGNYAKGIVSIVELYAISASAVAPQAGGYPSDINAWTDEAHDCAPTDAKPYQWNKTVTTYSDGSHDVFYHVSAVKGTKGESIKKTAETYRYATNNSGTRPAATSSDWKTTKPTLNKGYWLYTETTITWSDGSKTVLYTDERNPNDGVQGQDIIVDRNEVTYALTETNQQPSDSAFGTYPSTLAQGWWLWSKSTTYYKKATTSESAGSSSNYSVSYIAEDGDSGRGITSVTEYYKASDKSSGEVAPSDDRGWSTDPNTAMQSWNQTNKYLWNYEKVTYSSGTAIERSRPSVIAIWTKDGAAGKGIDSIVNYYKITNSLTPPSRDDSGWDDDPIAPTAQNPYLYNYEAITWINPSSTSYTSVQMIGHYGHDGISVRAQYSADGTSWHDSFTVTDIWMRTSTDNGTTWSTAMKIVGENGSETDFSFGISQYKTTANAQTAPSDISTWSDAPIAVISAKPYLWAKVEQKDGDGNTNSTTYIRLTGEDGNGIVSITRTFAISNIGTTASETTEPSHQGSWAASSPAVTEKYPYLWAKEVVVFTDTTKNTTKYYCIGGRGDNGVDAQDIEWVYIRTKTNTAPTILNDNTYTDTNGKTYTSDDHLPQVSGNANIENNNSKYQCTDDPKGVTDVWLYEWEIKRTKGAASNGHRSWNYYRGSMTLHNNFAESAFIIDIDNDNDQFGTDSDSKVLVTQTRSTTVAVYDGATQQKLNSLSAALTYEDGTSVASSVATSTSNKNTGVVSVTVLQSNTAFSHEAINATITAEVTGKGTKNAVFTIRKMMSGQPGLSPVIYNVNPTSKSFVFNRDASNNLTPSERTSTVNALKTIGNSTQDATVSDDLTYKWGFDDSTTAQESGKTLGTSIRVSNSDASSHYQVWVELSTGDRETLPIVKDGANGKNGKKGDSVAYDEEHSSIGYAYSSMGTPEAGRDYPSDITRWYDNPPAVQKGKYLWTKDVTAYNNAGTIVYTTTYGVQYQPNDGESVEIDSSRTFIKYCRQTKSQYTGQHPADSDFSTTYPTNLGHGDYLWILNQVAYVGVANPLKSYSVSMLGTDGRNGDKGADGYTTHFAYATSADGSQNFSTTNFVGATYIGTYRDQKAADSTNYRDYVWTPWKGDKGDNGDNGKDGKDAVNVSLSPEEVIVTQSTTSPYNIDLSNAETVVSVNEGGVPKSFTISNVSGTHCTASSIKSGTTDTIKITQIGQSGGAYYDNGYVTFDVIYGGNTYRKRFNFYANLLGTWKQSVEAGVETIAAEQVSYVINNGDEKKTIEQTRQAFNSVRSAAGSFEQWRTNTTDGYAADQESVNTRINNANQSIQTLSNNVGGLTESVSQIKQTADNINLSVQSGWKNYIANPLAAEAIATRYCYWVYGYSIVNDPVYGKVVQGASYGGDWQVLYDVASDYTDLTGQYVTWFCIVKNRDTSDKYHNINVSITLGGGWYPNTEQNGGASCSHSAVNVRRVNGELVVSSGLGGTSYTSRYSDISTGKQKLNDGWHLCWTTVKLAAGVSIIPGNNLIGFNSTTGQWSIYIAGVVKGKTCPTAESIRTHAGISKAGIDITSGAVDLMAERVTFSYYDTATQTRKGDKIWIDSTTGTLHAVDGDFEGKIKATSGTIGGFTIDDTRLYNSNWEAGVDISYGDYRKVKIGKNAAGEMDSEKAIMRAENTQTLGGSYNTVLYLNASGAVNNYAFYGKGNGVLDGYVQGFKVYAITNLAGTESNPYQVKLRNGMVQAIVSVDTNENKYLRLPKLGEIRQTLGINANATTNFTCQLVLINQSAIQSTSHNRDNVWVKGGSHNYSDLITSPDAIPRILRSNDSQDVGLNNANMLIFHITYINKRFIANYILG